MDDKNNSDQQDNNPGTPMNGEGMWVYPPDNRPDTQETSYWEDNNNVNF